MRRSGVKGRRERVLGNYGESCIVYECIKLKIVSIEGINRKIGWCIVNLRFEF